jgi:hypothetical protein
MRKREVPIKFFLSKSENEFMENKMLVAGIKNKSAYLRKMALDGYIINQDFSKIKDAVYELNKIGVNINQMTKVANNYGDINLSELKEMKAEIQKIERMLEKLV